MNYEAKRLKAIELMVKARDKGEWSEVAIIHNVIVKADNVVDTRHANGILDRLLKSEFCTYLTEGENKKNEE